jgi:hypothetical protein
MYRNLHLLMSIALSPRFINFTNLLVIMMDYYKSCKSNQALVRTGPRVIIIVNFLAQCSTGIEHRPSKE